MKLSMDIQVTARRKLLYLDDAEDLQDIQAVPGNRLEKLKGDRANQHSIRINVTHGGFVLSGFPTKPSM